MYLLAFGMGSVRLNRSKSIASSSYAFYSTVSFFIFIFFWLTSRKFNQNEEWAPLGSKVPKVDPRTFSLCLPLGTGKTSEMSWQGDRSLTLPKKPTTNSGDDNNNDESADYKRRPRRSNFHNDFSLLIYYFTITSNYLHLLSHGVLGLMNRKRHS